MAIDRGKVSLAGKISRVCGFGLAADGVDMQNGLEELERPEVAEFEGVSYGGRTNDVINPQDVQQASDLMAEIHERIYTMNIHMQQCALDAGNEGLAADIGERWQEFTQEIGGELEVHGEQAYVDGLKQAVTAYNDCVYDIGFMINCDPQAACEVRLNSEASLAMGRAKVSVHVHAEQELSNLVQKVEADLKAAYGIDFGVERDRQATMQFGMTSLAFFIMLLF